MHSGFYAVYFTLVVIMAAWLPTSRRLWFLRFAVVAFYPLIAVSPSIGSPQDYESKYGYSLEFGKGKRVCEHMARVYNERFRTPWNLTLDDPATPPYPRLPGVNQAQDAAYRFALLLSRYPRSEEFDAIDWREGRYSRGAREVPMLIAHFDINNDGQEDLVLKMGLMMSFYPAGRGAPGGDDELFVLPTGHLDLTRAVTTGAIYARDRPGTTARIGPDLLHMAARQIRPFVFEGRTYLSVYEQLSVLPDEPRNERTWILLYRGGGKEVAPGKWQTLELERSCRYRMILLN